MNKPWSEVADMVSNLKVAKRKGVEVNPKVSYIYSSKLVEEAKPSSPPDPCVITLELFDITRPA